MFFDHRNYDYLTLLLIRISLLSFQTIFMRFTDYGALLFCTFCICILSCSKELKPTVNECGAFIAPGVWKEFQCYNLGASNTSADPFTPGWEIIGGYWRWGGTAMAVAGPAGPDATVANDGAAGGWINSPAPNGSWSDDVKTSLDPCPAGYRVPSNSEWDGVIANNIQSSVGTDWTNSATNYSTGRKFGSKLFLPTAGDRYNVNGTLFGRGYHGYYWSSTVNGSLDAWLLYFDSGHAGTYSISRVYGQSVRCIAE
jgi:uncharacterized protein (TIGR02145 family)